MSDFLATYRLTQSPDFRARIRTAAYLAAQDILNEGIDKNRPRYVLAQQAQNLNDPVVDLFAWACAANASISAAEIASPGSAPDGDLRFVVTSEWNRVAGEVDA